jgi:hypothetical protein
MSEKVSALVEFFREEAAIWGNQGDLEGWSTEETAIHFLREYRQLGLAKAGDWDAILNHIGFVLRIELARHPAIGTNISLKEADALVTDLSSRLTYDIHKRLDPSYDS